MFTTVITEGLWARQYQFLSVGAFLRTTEVAKDATRLRFGMRDTKLIFDQLSDTATCPNRICVTEMGGTFFEESLEFGELFLLEFRRSPGSRLGSQGIDAVF